MRVIGKILLGLLSVVGFLTLLMVGLSIYAISSFKGNTPAMPVSGAWAERTKKRMPRTPSESGLSRPVVEESCAECGATAV